MNEPRVDEDHVRQLEAVGLLLAGALLPDERARMEVHLRSCELCRDELVDVAALPALLRRLPDVPHLSTVPASPSALARTRLLVAAGREEGRRVLRRRAAMAAAVLVPAIAALALVAGPGRQDVAGSDVTAMTQVAAVADVEGSLGTTSRPWGTEVTVRMRWSKGAPAVLVAVAADGREQEAGWWEAPAGRDVLCTGATSFAAADIVRWEVRSEAGSPLLVLDV